MSAAFTTRLLYAPSAELIDYAAQLGFNWVVIGSTGHNKPDPQDSPPVYLPDWPNEDAASAAAHAKYVEAERARLRELIDKAKSLGLNVMYHSYEPSLPFYFKHQHPNLWTPEVQEYVEAIGDKVKLNNNLCPKRQQVQDILAAKVRELVDALPGLDAFSYTNNETSSATKVWHRCDVCRDDPFVDNMINLHNALERGLDGSGVDLYYRGWGSHDHDHHYYQKQADYLELGLEADEHNAGWLRPYVEIFKDPKLHFLPTRDNPQFADFIKTVDTPVILKASWADCNLRHPLNIWLGKYKPEKEICEYSFEYCRESPEIFYIIGHEMQRRARHCRDLGITGFAAVPLCWGMQLDKLPRCSEPSKWMLGELNLILAGRLAHDPDVDLLQATREYLADRYGQPLPDVLAELLLETEDISDAWQNIRGVRCSGEGLRKLEVSLIRYGPMRDNWRELLRPTEEMINEVVATKQKALERTEEMLQIIDSVKTKLPEEAAHEFDVCFRGLNRMMGEALHKHHVFLIQRGLLTGDLPMTSVWLEKIGDLSRKRSDILSEQILPA